MDRHLPSFSVLWIKLQPRAIAWIRQRLCYSAQALSVRTMQLIKNRLVISHQTRKQGNIVEMPVPISTIRAIGS